MKVLVRREGGNREPTFGANCGPFEEAICQAEAIPHRIQQPERRLWYARMLLERDEMGDRQKAELSSTRSARKRMVASYRDGISNSSSIRKMQAASFNQPVSYR